MGHSRGEASTEWQVGALQNRLQEEIQILKCNIWRSSYKKNTVTKKRGMKLEKINRETDIPYYDLSS